MNEKDLIELWNDKRRQIISAQMPSVIALAVITVMAMLGYFDGDYNYGISFAALFLVSVGALSILNQLAVIREGQMIIKDLQAVDNQRAGDKDCCQRFVPGLHARADDRFQPRIAFGLGAPHSLVKLQHA